MALFFIFLKNSFSSSFFVCATSFYVQVKDISKTIWLYGYYQGWIWDLGPGARGPWSEAQPKSSLVYSFFQPKILVQKYISDKNMAQKTSCLQRLKHGSGCLSESLESKEPRLFQIIS
jgi:hypothetical protein